MEKFKKYLILSQIMPEKRVQFYVNWVSKYQPAQIDMQFTNIADIIFWQ